MLENRAAIQIRNLSDDDALLITEFLKQNRIAYFLSLMSKYDPDEV